MNFKTQLNLYTSGDIKREAKAQLAGHWTDAVLVALIPSVFAFLFFRSATDNVLISVLLDMLQAFLVTGVTFGFMNLLRNKRYKLQPFQEILAPFRTDYFKNLLFLKIWKYFFVFLWSLLLIIPGIVKAYGYSQAELIYKDYVNRTGDQPDARACLEESQKLMQGHKTDLFVLELSFIGWHILNAFTYGILSLWLTPYTTMSRVVFYENITEGSYLTGTQHGNRDSTKHSDPMAEYEEVGKDPDDFRDFEDF